MTSMEISSSYPSFSGSIPEHYDKYSGPVFFEPYAIEVSMLIDPSLLRVVLELGCGTGRVTRHLRSIIPATGRIIASDISEDMLVVAKEKLKKLDIDWQIIDARELPFNDNSIDLVVCCFGYMFVPDKLKAFAEAFRVLRPGGMLIFTTWDKLELNGASQVYRKTIKEYLKDALPESYNLPFSFNDPAIIKELLSGACFSTTIIESVEKMSVSPSSKEAAKGLTQGGSLYNEIMKRNPAWLPEITATVERKLTEKYGAEPMAAPMKALICRAWK